MTQAWDEALAQQRIDELKHMDGAALPIMHALQAEFGYIDDAAIPLIADALNLSRAEIVGVVHFYHDFRHEPPGRHVLKICRAEACQSMGSEALWRHASQGLGVEPGSTSPDGAVTYESVYCLGNCALSPAVMLDDNLYGRVSPRRLHDLITEARA